MAILTETDVNYFKRGTLEIGSAESLANVASRARNVELSPETDSEDDVPVLSGDVIAGASSTTWTLSLTLVPDLGTENSVWEFFFNEDGNIHPFTFRPSDKTKKEITGSLRVTPAGISGEAEGLGEAEVELKLIGKPTLKTAGA